MTTHLTGRYDTKALFPMSWKEYLRYSALQVEPGAAHSTGQKSRLNVLCEEYLRSGGIFEYYTLGKSHIRTLFGAIIHKDIFARYDAVYPQAVEELAMLMVNSYASKISMNKLAGHLNVKSSHTVKEYLGYLKNTFLMFSTGKWSCKLREQQSAAPKVYIADNGIIDSLSFAFSAKGGRFLENAVAVELQRRSRVDDSEVYCWDDYRNECDFVLKKGTAVVSAIRVCHELTQDNRQRELAGLNRAMCEFGLQEGLIVAADQTAEEAYEGKYVRIVPFYVWAAGWRAMPFVNSRDGHSGFLPLIGRATSHCSRTAGLESRPAGRGRGNLHVPPWDEVASSPPDLESGLATTPWSTIGHGPDRVLGIFRRALVLAAETCSCMLCTAILLRTSILTCTKSASTRSPMSSCP